MFSLSSSIPLVLAECKADAIVYPDGVTVLGNSSQIYILLTTNFRFFDATKSVSF